MNAKFEGYINSLSKLSDNVPLKTPYGIRFSLGNTCNFKCVYCSLFKENTGIAKGYEKVKMMSLEEFLLMADQISEFEEPIRQISFVSRGETLLNKALPDMIKTLKSRNLAKQVKIVTNAKSLTHEMSDRLLGAGLDVLKISLQGLNAKTYKDVCRINIDWDVFVNQIKYFYERRGTCKLQVKIIDIALEKADEPLFYEIFGSISDYIFIEKCSGDMKKEKDSNVNKFDFVVEGMKTCPLPFYTMTVSHNGDVTSCCMVKGTPISGLKTVIANAYNKKLKRIWDEDFMALQLSLLEKSTPTNLPCSNCTSFLLIEKTENCLDNDKQEIIKRYLVVK